MLEPLAILDRHKIQKQGAWLSEVFIQWQHLLDEEPSWELKTEIRRLYPHFDLEDKASFKGGVLIQIIT